MEALQRNASGHLQSVAIHPTCFLGTQKSDNATDIIGNTDPSQCNLGSDHFVYMGLASKAGFVKSVSMAPGATRLALIPLGVNSFAMYFVNTSIAPFMDA